MAHSVLPWRSWQQFADVWAISLSFLKSKCLFLWKPCEKPCLISFSTLFQDLIYVLESIPLAQMKVSEGFLRGEAQLLAAPGSLSSGSGWGPPDKKPGPPSRRSIGEEDGGTTSWGVSTQPGDLQQHLVCGHRAQGSSLGAQPAHICGLFHSTAPHHRPTPHRDLLFHHHLSLRKGAACVNSFPLLSYLNKVSSLPQSFHTQGIFAAITSSAVSTTPPPPTPSPKGIAVSIKELLQEFKEKKE